MIHLTELPNNAVTAIRLGVYMYLLSHTFWILVIPTIGGEIIRFTDGDLAGWYGNHLVFPHALTFVKEEKKGF